MAGIRATPRPRRLTSVVVPARRRRCARLGQARAHDVVRTESRQIQPSCRGRGQVGADLVAGDLSVRALLDEGDAERGRAADGLRDAAPHEPVIRPCSQAGDHGQPAESLDRRAPRCTRDRMHSIGLHRVHRPRREHEPPGRISAYPCGSRRRTVSTSTSPVREGVPHREPVHTSASASTQGHRPVLEGRRAPQGSRRPPSERERPPEGGAGRPPHAMRVRSLRRSSSRIQQVVAGGEAWLSCCTTSTP